MAIGSTKGAGVRRGTGPLPGSALSYVVTANDDARTAQTAAMSYNPSTITDSVFHWVRVPPGTTRVLCRAKVPKATTAVGTSPIVKIVGAISRTGAHDDCAGVTDGAIEFQRLDAATWAAAGQTLTFPASPSTTNCYNDSTYFYSDVISLTAIDLQGCEWVGVLVTTLGACTASAAMPVDLTFQN